MSVDERAADRLIWLEAQEAPVDRASRLAARIWAALWPKLLAIAIVLAVWELIHLSGWKKLIFPGPSATLSNLWGQLGTGLLWHAIATTLQRAGDRFWRARLDVLRARGAGGAGKAAPGGRRVADYRAADDAVDRVVPVRDHPVRDLDPGHPVRDHPRCRP